MPSRSESARPVLTAEAFALALLLASSLQIMENLVPRVPVFPWLKLGLSYVVILPFLVRYGSTAAFALLTGRNLLGVLYGGQLFSTFLISTGSGFATFFLLGIPVVHACRRGWLGLAGASVMLATMFNVSQLFLVESVLIGHAGFYFQLGPLLAWSIASGLAVAYLIHLSQDDLEAAWDAEAQAGESAARVRSVVLPGGNPWGFAASLLALSGVLAVRSTFAQAVALPLIVLVSILASHAKSGAKQESGVIRSLLTAWPLLLYLAWLHLFHTPGRLVWHGLTAEGIDAFLLHAVRLANLVLVGQWLARTLPVRWFGHSSRPWLRGFVIALPLLPGLFRFSREAGRQVARRWWRGERANLLTPVFDAWKNKVFP